MFRNTKGNEKRGGSAVGNWSTSSLKSTATKNGEPGGGKTCVTSSSTRKKRIKRKLFLVRMREREKYSFKGKTTLYERGEKKKYLVGWKEEDRRVGGVKLDFGGGVGGMVGERRKSAEGRGNHLFVHESKTRVNTNY